MAFSVYACCVLRCAGSYAAGLCAKRGAQRALITLSRFMCTFEFASFAAFRDGQRGAAGRVLGFSVRTLCVLRALVTFGIWRRGTRKCHTMAAIPGFNGGNTSYCLRAGGRSILSGRGSAQVADW